jgi:translation initiation factor 2-alpha kinase 4
MAEPIVDDVSLVTPLELFVVTFETPYYITSQGKKKLYQVDQEIKNLINVRHPKLLSVCAVKLVFPPNSSPLLMVLTEQPPALTLHDVLEDCESLREDRASVRLYAFC